MAGILVHYRRERKRWNKKLDKKDEQIRKLQLSCEHADAENKKLAGESAKKDEALQKKEKTLEDEKLRSAEAIQRAKLWHQKALELERYVDSVMTCFDCRKKSPTDT
jgi:hypothetical protein